MRNFWRMWQTFRAIILFAPPLLLYSTWAYIERERFNPFSPIEVIGGNYFEESQMDSIKKLADALYEIQSASSSAPFGKPEAKTDFDNFKDEIRVRFVEEIGVFSQLPLHEVCLVNKNKIFLNGTEDPNTRPREGVAAIKQNEGYNFDALRNSKDCNMVSINRFRNSSSSVEYSYPLVTIISGEGLEKKQRGEKYLIQLATSSVDTSRSFISISLHWWTFFPFFFFALFAWSLIVFQCDKIYHFVRRNEVGL